VWAKKSNPKISSTQLLGDRPTEEKMIVMKGAEKTNIKRRLEGKGHSSPHFSVGGQKNETGRADRKGETKMKADGKTMIGGVEKILSGGRSVLARRGFQTQGSDLGKKINC